MLLGQAVQLAAQKADWKVGIQTWTFHNLTLMETLDKTQQLGMGYAEAFFFQELGAPFPKETYLNYDLSDDDCALLRHEFKKRGIKPIAFGVASYGTNEEWDKFFAFAHKIGAHIVTVDGGDARPAGRRRRTGTQKQQRQQEKEKTYHSSLKTVLSHWSII